jgi:WD40 repeat protein
VSADNSKFASAGGDRQLFLWDVATGQTIRKFAGHDGVINSVRLDRNDTPALQQRCSGTLPVAFSPNHEMLASAGATRWPDSDIQISSNCKLRRLLVACSPNNEVLATGAYHKAIRFRLPNLKQLQCRGAQVAFSPNNEVIATGGYDQAVKLWDTRSRAHQALQVARPFADSVTSVTITSECAHGLVELRR